MSTHVRPSITQPPTHGADAVGAAASIARLQAEVTGLTARLNLQAESMKRRRTTFERAAATAKIGLWECDLSNESLSWTNQVYDLFDLRRGSAIDRHSTLEHYAPASFTALVHARSKAIADRSGFNLDAEIVSAKGRRRWMRVTATVECNRGAPVRIFGMKQDITEEKLMADRLRYLAEVDVLTGLANRASFQAKLADIGVNAGPRPFSALLLIDLDGFKQINDTFGHACGDEYLKYAALCLRTVCREPHFVARIGGDEFAVLLDASCGPDTVERIARDIVAALRQPLDGQSWPFKTGASVGIARMCSGPSAELFNKADAALYAAKASGRDTFRMFGSELQPLQDAAGSRGFEFAPGPLHGVPAPASIPLGSRIDRPATAPTSGY